ncbi:MAG: Hvo_1808 family surface protein [Halodesulfurarchaeum sp.]
MRHRPVWVIGLTVVLLVLAGCSGVPIPEPPVQGPGGGSGGALEHTTGPIHVSVEPVEMIETRPDPEADPLGWEGGYWHNETIPVESTDGINGSELAMIVSRSKARVEDIRGIEFQNDVSVEIITRETFRSEFAGGGVNLTTAQRLHQEVKFEALFFVGENRSAIQQRRANTAANVLAFYAPGNDSIKLISDGTGVVHVNELTLAQELYHAQQDQQFNISRYTQNTEELHNAIDGIVEGDANYVEYRYRKRCESGWSCLSDTGAPAGGSGRDPHLGMLALRLQPYSDGPVFVHRIYTEQGWAGVNEVYENPPASTEQTIHPAKYRIDQPTTVTIGDRSNETYDVPDQGEGHIDYAQFGEAGLYVMLWYPSGITADVIIPGSHFFGPSSNGGLDLYNYSYNYSAGWDGDRLLPYVRNDSARSNETGYVWKITWDSRADAAEFLDGYRKLLRYHGASAVPGRPGTYRIPSGPFADAFYVTRSGTTVIIVNAPTVSDLDAVREGAGERT